MGTASTVSKDSASSGGAGRGAGQDIRTLTIFKTRPDSIVDKKGARGSFVELATNYFAVNHMPNTRLEQWRVDLKPDTDNMFLKKRLVNSLISELGNFVFDGTLLYTFYKLAGGDDPRVNRVVTDPETNQQYTIVMKLVGEVCTGLMSVCVSLKLISAFFRFTRTRPGICWSSTSSSGSAWIISSSRRSAGNSTTHKAWWPSSNGSSHCGRDTLRPSVNTRRRFF